MLAFSVMLDQRNCPLPGIENRCKHHRFLGLTESWMERRDKR